jgi:hypothetical protein
MKEKLEKVRKRRYIGEAFIQSLTAFFAVPKGLDDISMVYDGTVSGLNDCTWVPRFVLPTIETHLRSVDEDTYMADVDVGDCFLNFILHKDLQELAGVDLTHYFGEGDEGRKLWEAWKRAPMRVKSSPYQAVSALTVLTKSSREITRMQQTSSSGWEFVLTCPETKTIIRAYHGFQRSTGMEKLRPTFSPLWMIFDRPDPDDENTGKQRDELPASLTGSVFKTPLGREGTALRSQEPGWGQSSTWLQMEGVCVLLASEDKWIKAKGFVEEVQTMLDEDPMAMPRHWLEPIRGFLIYATTRTYPCMVPYLIGFHLTIDSWQPDRKDDGWRFTASEMKLRARAMEDEVENSPKAPVLVKAAPRLQWDIDALRSLMSAPEPLVRKIRRKKSLKAYYGFGDASGYAFGGSIQVGDNLWYEYGQWSTQFSEENSSNWQELANLVNFIKRSIETHGLAGVWNESCNGCTRKVVGPWQICGLRTMGHV